MKKTILVLSVAVMVALPLVFGATYAGAVGKLKIDQPAEFFKGAKKTKPGTEFDHDAHNTAAKLDCAECHHTEDPAALKAAGAAKPKACVNAECHQATEKVVNGKKMVNGNDAYHKNCKDCHKKVKKGPTKCGACHAGAAEE